MEKTVSAWLVLLFIIAPSYGNLLPDESEKKLQEQIENLSLYLEKFNVLYLTTLDQKLTTISSAVTTLDTNLKALQEKAHVWDIFQHHIQAWTDHMKSVDHKIDLIKLSQDETQSIESKLNSLEFAINHVISKVDALSNKNQDVGPLVVQKLDDIYKIVNNRERADGYEKKEMLVKLSSLMRHVLTIENDSVRKSRDAKIREPANEGGEKFHRNMDDLEIKVDKMLEEISGHNLDEVFSVTKKNSEVIGYISELIQGIDERTLRLYDAEASHSSKIISCCRSSKDELTTFTGSADLLLKRIEQLMLALQNRVEKGATNSNEKDSKREETAPDEEEKETSTTKPEERKPEDRGTEEEEKEVTADKEDAERKEESSEDEKVDTKPKQEDKENDSGEEEISSSEWENEFPDKAGCHELTKRIDGIYKFRNESLFGDRNINERFCAFPTDGMGWTVIQKRGPYEVQENFNRTWNEYKYGFGDLSRDFWFGNEFIHRIVYKDSYELRIELEDFDDVQVWTEYSTFQIDPEQYNYTLMIGEHRGAVRDSMFYHHDMDFSTYDRRKGPCADDYGSGWWFNNCLEANLNGIYRDTPTSHNYIGIIWENWHGDYSLKKTRMLIRPKNVWPDDEVDGEFPESPPEDP